MATLGQKLKAAREAKGVTESEAGAATKILRRIILNMERDDFSDMPAPAYAKGFIRLYAGYLGLDSEPLVEEYLQTHAGKPGSPAGSPSGPEQEPLSGQPSGFSPSARINLGDWFSKAAPGGLLRLLRQTPLRDIRVQAAAVAGLLVLIVLLVSISNCARRRAAAQPAAAPAPASSKMLINEPVPDLYLVEPGKIESR